jgi:hypothetical protein
MGRIALDLDHAIRVAGCKHAAANTAIGAGGADGSTCWAKFRGRGGAKIQYTSLKSCQTQ